MSELVSEIERKRVWVVRERVLVVVERVSERVV